MGDARFLAAFDLLIQFRCNFVRKSTQLHHNKCSFTIPGQSSAVKPGESMVMNLAGGCESGSECPIRPQNVPIPPGGEGGAQCGSGSDCARTERRIIARYFYEHLPNSRPFCKLCTTELYLAVLLCRHVFRCAEFRFDPKLVHGGNQATKYCGIGLWPALRFSWLYRSCSEGCHRTWF